MSAELGSMLFAERLFAGIRDCGIAFPDSFYLGEQVVVHSSLSVFENCRSGIVKKASLTMVNLSIRC